MAIALSGTPVASTSGGTVTTTITVTLASTTVGAYNVIALSANTSGTGVDPAPTTPTGWTLLGTSGKTGTPYHRLSIYGRFYQAGDGTTVGITIAANGNMSAACVGYSGVDTTTPVVTGESLFQPQPASSTSWNTGNITTAGSRWIVAVFANRTNGTWSALTDTTRITQITASSANVAYEDSNGALAAGTYNRTATYSVATSVGNTGILALNPASSGTTYSGAGDMTSAASLAGQGTLTDTAVMSSASGLTGAAAATLGAAASMMSASTVTGTARTPIVQQLLTGGVQWPAHRGGYASTLGEETLEAYTAAAAQYSKAILEISIWDTSDGVYVCSHDQTTGRVFSGTNYTITSTAWATLSPNGSSTVGRPTTIIGGNPLRRLEEILDAFPTRLFLIENKHGTNQGTLSALLDSHAPGRWMFKGPYNDTANANIAASHGAPMWLYFYPSQLGSLSTTYAAVSSSGVPIVFGLGDYSTAPVPVQSDATTFFTFTTSNGLMAWAHILGSSGQKTTADSQASAAGSSFNGYMTSAYSALAPNDSTTSTMVSGSMLTGAGTLGAAGSAGMASASALAGSATLTTPDSAGMASASTLGGSATAGEQSAGGMASASVLTGTATAIELATAGMASASVLAGSAARTTPAAGGMQSASALIGSESAIEPDSAGMVSASTVTSGASVTAIASAPMASASTLAGNAAPPGTGAAMASGSSLTGSAAATEQAVSGMASSSALAGAASVIHPSAAIMVSGSSLTGDSTAGGLSAASMGSASSLSGVPVVVAQVVAGMASGSTVAAVTAAQLSALAAMQSTSALSAAATVPTAGQDIIFTAVLAAQTYRFTAALAARLHRFSAELGPQSRRFTATLRGQP